MSGAATARKWDYAEEEELEYQETEPQYYQQTARRFRTTRAEETRQYDPEWQHRYWRHFERQGFYQEPETTSRGFSNASGVVGPKGATFSTPDLASLAKWPLVVVFILAGWFAFANISGVFAQSDLDVARFYPMPSTDITGVTLMGSGAVATNSNTNIIGAPSVSADLIDSVLRKYNSPATGVGRFMVEQGQKYGIDPAYALAFFIHESTAGTKGIATVTKSIGNIRYTPGYENYQGFRKYATWEAGIEDWFKLIKNQYVNQWKLTTIEAIVPVYAPAADNNNPAAYINQVNSLVAGWRSGK